MAEHYDVVVAGAGPVGLALALDLGQRGVRCALLEREVSPHRIPKGQSLTNRTLEHFYFWKCIDALRAARKLPKDFPIGGVTAYQDLTSPHWYYQEGGGPGRGAAVSTLFFQPPERLPQYETERVLRGRLSELTSVTAMFGWQLVEAGAESERMRITAQETSGNRSLSLSCTYLVGADGARSTVRTLFDIGSTTRDLGDRMVLLVFRSPQFEERVAKLPPSTTLRILKPQLNGHWQFFGRVDARDTWFFHSPVPKEVRLTDADLVALLRSAAGFAFEAQILHAGYWDLRISISDVYRKGRVFIAGDACHSHPPYGGFGLNTGLEDARNLGWKLAAALQGWGGEALLESYGLERRPVFMRTADMIADGIVQERAFLESYNPKFDQEMFEAAWSELSQKAASAAYLPHYAGSPVVADGASAASPGIDGLATMLANAGHHLGPAVLTGGSNLFAILGEGFHLLALDAPEAAAVFQAAAQKLAVPLSITNDTFEDQRALYGKRLILIRPDQYVAWTDDRAPADAEALLRQVAGLDPALVSNSP